MIDTAALGVVEIANGDAESGIMKLVVAIDMQMECSTEPTGKANIDSRYETFDPAGSEKSYLLSVF